MKIADYMQVIEEQIPDLGLHCADQPAQQIAAFIPLMTRLGCHDGARILRDLIGKPSDTDTSSVYQIGILSADMEQYSAMIRSHHADAFEQTESLSKEAWGRMRIWRADPSRASGGRAMVFLQKSVQACQSTLLLAERGLELEAATVLREAYDYLFVGCAMLRVPASIDRLIRESEREFQKQAEKLLRPDNGKPVIAEKYIGRLRDLADGRVEGSGFSVYSSAQIAGLEGVYDAVYRELSRIGVHGTVQTLLHGEGPDGRMSIGPDDRLIASLLDKTRDCLQLALAHGREGRTTVELHEALRRGDDRVRLWQLVLEMRQALTERRRILLHTDTADLFTHVYDWMMPIDSLFPNSESGRKSDGRCFAQLIADGEQAREIIEELISRAGGEDGAKPEAAVTTAITDIHSRLLPLLDHLRKLAIVCPAGQ